MVIFTMKIRKVKGEDRKTKNFLNFRGLRLIIRIVLIGKVCLIRGLKV